MDVSSPEFLYMGFILPGLFALTLVGEGIYKIHNQEEGFFVLILGIFFLLAIAGGYYLFILK